LQVEVAKSLGINPYWSWRKDIGNYNKIFTKLRSHFGHNYILCQNFIGILTVEHIAEYPLFFIDDNEKGVL
jgi:hypothetical protein